MTVEISLKDKNILIMGVANKRSIAWAIAKTYAAAGANLIFSYQDERLKDKVGRLLEKEIPGALLFPCNVAEDEEIAKLAEDLKGACGVLHGIVHSIAYARKEELAGRYADTSREGFLLAQDISVYSLTAVTQRLSPLMTEGGNIITLTFQGSMRVAPNYNVMGVAKAALEASVRYLANDLGSAGIRVNAISAGPIRTVSAKGVKDFDRLLQGVADKAPLKRLANVDDVAGAALFLVSSLSSCITGTVIYVDGGYHIMA